MSKYEAELCRRLESGASMQETAEWYMNCMVKENCEWKDLSLIEVRFMKEIKEGHDRWMKGPGRRH
jgi:hypothetical protein